MKLDYLRAAKTAAQIREDMFKAEGTNLTHFNSAADASTDGLVGRWVVMKARVLHFLVQIQI